MWKMGANCTTATQRMEDINKRRNKAATKTEAIKYPCVCVCVSVFILLLVFFNCAASLSWENGKLGNGHKDTASGWSGGVKKSVKLHCLLEKKWQKREGSRICINFPS